MEFLRFSLGVRFAKAEGGSITPEDCWRMVFESASPLMTKGLQIFGTEEDVFDGEREQAYDCILSNASLSRSKALYTRLRENLVLSSHLCAYAPFVQNNRLERVKKVEFLGNVGEDGSLTGGAVAYAGMKFTGKNAWARRSPYAPRIFIAPTGMGAFSAAEVARDLMRAAALRFPEANVGYQRIADGGKGTLDALMEAHTGRYLVAKTAQDGQPVRYGILPDRTVVLETEPLRADTQQALIDEIAEAGYRTFLLAAGDGEAPQSFPPACAFTILSHRPGAVQPAAENVVCRSGVQTVLDSCGFFRLATGARLVVTATDALDGDCSRLSATADTVLYHCREKRIRTVTLALRPDGTFCMKRGAETALPLAAGTLGEAAMELFTKIASL